MSQCASIGQQIKTFILWDKTVPAAYAERVVVFYLLEKSLTRFYNIFPV